MPRKSKEKIEELNIKEKSTAKNKALSTSKKTTPSSKKESLIKKEVKKTAKKEPKKTSPKKITSSKKETNSKDSVDIKKAVKKSGSTNKNAKKTTSKKSTLVKKSPSTKKISNSKTSKKSTLEYYDLPYRYSQTIVKVLAQTPKMLFVYWDISDEDRQNYINKFGENFFNDTIPFLRIINETDNYTFDVDVDDFANSWYLPINDSKCKYSINLFRKQRPYRNKIIDNELYITSSNEMIAPNDSILFNINEKSVYFKDIKNGNIVSKDMSSLSFIRNIGKIYNIYELYKRIYKDEISEDSLNLNNPSSGNPTSTFK